MQDGFPVKFFYSTSNNYFEPYEFECEIKELSSNSYKIKLIKDRIMRQILLDMEYEEDFRIHPEILKEYQ